MSIYIKATKQYFPVVLFIVLYKVVLTFEFVDEILKCDHSNESCLAALLMELLLLLFLFFCLGAILEYPATYLHIPERFIERGI